MGQSGYVFQVDSFPVKKVFEKEKNFLIEHSHDNHIKGERYCIIYFSSNDIYYPNTPEAFKNRFEWYGTRIVKGEKHIFLQYIFKQWYLKGINNELNSIEKLVTFLITEAEGYRTITVGSSAGGFAAVLFGQKLNSETIFSFNGQFTLYDLLLNSPEFKNPIIFREASNASINKYYSLSEHITNSERVFYFYSMNSK